MNHLANFAAAVARNKRKSVVLALYALCTLAVFVIRYRQYAAVSASPFPPLARAAAAGIYLNFVLVLIPMMRLALSRKSFRYLNVIMPFHKSIEAHEIAASAILFFSMLHVAAYALLYSLNGKPFLANMMSRSANWTGLTLAVLLALIGWGAVTRTMRSYERFYYTHFLSVPVIVLCCFHAPLFWRLMALPLALYLVDRSIRAFWSAHRAEIERLEIVGRDIALTIRRPEMFDYRSGDYAFLCIPAISRWQWHPFSLINPPSSGGSLSFRIRRYGSWTDALSRLTPGEKLYLDGPFASPSRDLHQSPRSIIVAAGIGITPFASYLYELRNQLGAGQKLSVRMVLYWLERDVPSFAAFLELIADLRHMLAESLEVHLIAASLPDGPGSALISSRQIDWDDEFRRLSALPDLQDATVFFCGPKPLSAKVRTSSRRHSFKFRTESF
jgi:NADPH oxidase 5